MTVDINLTTLLSSTISSVFNGAAVFLTIRYLGKMVDKVERKNKDKDKE